MRRILTITTAALFSGPALGVDEVSLSQLATWRGAPIDDVGKATDAYETVVRELGAAIRILRRVLAVDQGLFVLAPELEL